MIHILCDNCCDAYDISYIDLRRRLVAAGATSDCIWMSTVEEWTDRPGTRASVQLQPRDQVVISRTAFHPSTMCSARSVGSPPLQMSRRLGRLGAAFVLCLLWIMEKSVSREHSGRPSRSAAPARPIGPRRFMYTCFTLTIISASSVTRVYFCSAL